MRNNTQLVYRLVLVIGDFLTLVAAFSAAYILRVKYDDRPLIEQIPAETYLYAILIVLPLWVLIHGAIGLYTKNVYENRFSELGKLVLGSVIGILAVLSYDFIVDENLFPARLVVVYGFLLSLGFLVVFRTLTRFFRRALFSYGIGITNLLVVGSGRSTEKIIEQFIDTDATGYRIIGSVGEKPILPDIPVYKTIKELDHKLKSRVHSVIQTKLYKNDEENSDILNYAQANHLEYRFIPANSELYSGNIEVELFREIPVITVHQTALIGWGRVVKRLFDLILGSLILTILSPVILLVIILQKLTDPKGAIFLRQKRLTQFDRGFTVFKFRSHKTKYNGMSPEKAFKAMGEPELAKEYRRNGDFLANDPRISRLGKLLRITSIDELPQLFNVVKGDISLVGPRALIPEELAEYQEKHRILSVKSGMTGLAQVSGRRNLSFNERRKLDVYYVQNWSFWLDITILFRTIRVVLGGSGAK